MKNRPYAVLLSAVFLTTLVVGTFSGKMQAQSRRVPPEVHPPQGTTESPASIQAPIWEYRILRGLVAPTTITPRLQRRDSDSVVAPIRSYGQPGLEAQIKELAELGYEVQSVNVVTPPCASRDSESAIDAIALLKRMKK